MATESPQLYNCLPIPDGNWKDIYENQAITMALVHNVFIRGFNSMLYYSGEAQPGTKQLVSFLNYSLEVVSRRSHYVVQPKQLTPEQSLHCNMVHHHHQGEETLFFPFLEEKMGAGRMSGNVAAHEAFGKPFEAFEEHLKKLISDPSLWDARVFRESIHNFMPVLREHLSEELTTLDVTELRKFITPKDFEEFEKRFLEEIKKTLSFVRGPQIVFVNGDSVNGNWFPPFPGPLVFLIKDALYWVHSDMWKFGCCDKNKRVKAPFMPYEPPVKK